MIVSIPQPCFTICINSVGANCVRPQASFFTGGRTQFAPYGWKNEKYIFHLGSFVLSGQKGKPELGYARPQKTSTLQRSSAHYTYQR